MSLLSTDQDFSVRKAIEADEPQILTLLPYLADFDYPPKRDSTDLWSGDVVTAKAILTGKTDASFIDVVTDRNDQIVGLMMVTLRDEMLSHAPSAHLEAIALAPSARGTGLGKRLMKHCETRVRELGAASLTLHVFNRNERARSLYASEGFDEELIRAIKWLD